LTPLIGLYFEVVFVKGIYHIKNVFDISIVNLTSFHIYMGMRTTGFEIYGVE